MIWAAIKAFFAKPIWRAIGDALGRVPWQVWAGVALAALVLLYGHHREAQGRYKGRAEIMTKWDAEKAAQLAALAEEEQALRQITKDTDNAINQSRVAHNTTVERFIARGGVQSQACPDNRDATDRSAGSSAPVHQAPVMVASERVQGLVTVLADDVRICTDNTFLAEGFREQLLKLEGRAGE